MTGDVAAALRQAVNLGLSAVPAAADGSKRPMPAAGGAWEEYKHRLPSPDEITRWAGRNPSGFGIVTGAVSGNLEMFELEGRAVKAGLWDEFLAAGKAAGLGPLLDRITAGYHETTPSGGLHLLWRCPEIEPSLKLARGPGGHNDLWIETRGEGGFTIVAPSNGTTHPTGGRWELQQGGLGTIATISPDERRAVLDLARSFDRTPLKPDGDRPGGTQAGSLWEIRPGDDFNQRGDWVIERHGWTRLYTSKDGNQCWRRPGKETGVSATISDNGNGCLYVFTSSTPFEPNRGYSKFSAYVILEHGGDVDTAVQALEQAGYGRRKPPVDLTGLIAPSETPRDRSDVTKPAPPPAIVAQVQAEHPDLDEAAVWDMARAVLAGVTTEQQRRLTRRIVDDLDASRAMNLGRAHVVTGGAFLQERTSPPAKCLGGLVGEGHNAVLAAQYKAGKTTLVENVCRALVDGEPFLGIFPTRRPYRVALLNYEMTADDCRARLQQLAISEDGIERLLVLNLRGVGLSLTVPAGRAWLVDQLRRHRAEVAIIDTYGAASAPSVESENDNAGGRRFLMAWDAIKADAGVHTSIVTHHTGRAPQNEGEEHGRGATVIDDWADVRLILTRDRDSGQRFLASEGRSAYNLPESRLLFEDAARRLYLPESSVGENRREARDRKNAEAVSHIVGANPGIITTKLREALPAAGITKGEHQSTAISTAKRRGLIHAHGGVGNSVRHYLGAVHGENEQCPDPSYEPLP